MEDSRAWTADKEAVVVEHEYTLLAESSYIHDLGLRDALYLLSLYSSHVNKYLLNMPRGIRCPATHCSISSTLLSQTSVPFVKNAMLHPITIQGEQVPSLDAAYEEPRAGTSCLTFFLVRGRHDKPRI